MADFTAAMRAAKDSPARYCLQRDLVADRRASLGMLVCAATTQLSRPPGTSQSALLDPRSG